MYIFCTITQSIVAVV